MAHARATAPARAMAPARVDASRPMWEALIVCKACEEEHLVCAEFIPRAFAFECPSTQNRVEMRFRDPSRMSRDWTEVSSCSPASAPVIEAEKRGQF